MRNNVIKNKPCQFKPTHLKLQLIMKVELVRSMSKREVEEVEERGRKEGGHKLKGMCFVTCINALK